MTSTVLHTQAGSFSKKRPEIRPGFTVRVHERIQEGSKERVQVFEGLVISVHKGHTKTDATFTVRRLVSGVGVEKVFSLHSPNIEKIEVKKVANVRRAKLFFLRGRRGKAARLSERFTTAEEFAIAADDEEVAEEIVHEQEESAGELADEKAKEEAEAAAAEGDADSAGESTEESAEPAAEESNEASEPEVEPAVDEESKKEEEKTEE